MAVASLVTNILIIAEVRPFVNLSPTVTIVSLICSAILTIASTLIILNSRYLFKEKGIMLLWGFFGYTIPYKDIFEIKEHSVSKELFILYKEPQSKIPDKTNAMQILVKQDKNQSIVDKIKSGNSSVIYTVYTPEN
jgi:hypothetical protein